MDEGGEEEEERKQKKGGGSCEEDKNAARSKGGMGRASNDRCKTVSTYNRMKEFPDQTLFVESGQLMCEACSRKPISKNKHTVRQHCGGKTHTPNVAALNMSKQKKQVCACLCLQTSCLQSNALD